MQYTIVWNDSPIMVKNQVNELLSEGWKLQGGVGVGHGGAGTGSDRETVTWYAQALVRD